VADTPLSAVLGPAGYGPAEESARTETSTLYRAEETATGAIVEAEEFNIPLSPAAVAEVNQHAGTLAETRLAGVFAPLSCGVTETGKLYVVRELPGGMPLRELIRERFAGEGHFSPAEVLNLLGPVAEAIDHYAAAGQSNFVWRSIDVDRLLAQPGWASAPVKMSLVGPTPHAVGSSAEHNRQAFIDLVADLTGMAVDPAVVASTGTCANYLRALAGEPVEEPRASVGHRLAGRVPSPSSTSPWPWFVATLALFLLAVAGAWWWANERGDTWEGAEAEIQRTYPDLVSRREGGKGWNGLRCESVTPEPGQTAKIRCADEETGVSVAKYTSAGERNAGLPGQDKAVVLGSGACTISSYEVPNVSPRAFVLAPSDHQEYRILINGNDAEEQRLQLPLCPGQ